MYPHRPLGNDRGVTTPAILLSGGCGRRLGGVDKGAVEVGAGTLLDRAVAALGTACAPVVVVDRTTTADGPLAAVAAGWALIGQQAEDRPDGAVVLAVDMPFVPAALLAWLVAQPGSVVPVVDGHPQPLCARYEGAQLDRAVALVAEGARSMHALLDAGPVHFAAETEWHALATPGDFVDVDTPADLAAARHRANSGG